MSRSLEMHDLSPQGMHFNPVITFDVFSLMLSLDSDWPYGVLYYVFNQTLFYFQS